MRPTFLWCLLVVGTVLTGSSAQRFPLSLLDDGDRDGYTITEFWITQRLDNLGHNVGNVTFLQKYLVNDEHWKGDGSPVFLMIGPEGPLSSSYVSEKCLGERLAKRFGGLVVALEHRFYGDSTPFPPENLTTAHLRYLSSRQALADLAWFHSDVVARYNAARSPWVCLGGSYGGALSAWLRIKYPHLVAGAVAVAAPVNVTVTPEWNGNLFRSAAKVGGASCAGALSLLFRETFPTLLHSEAGQQQMEELFAFLNISDIIKYADKSPAAEAAVVSKLSRFVANAVEFNYGLPFLAPWAYPLSEFCHRMCDAAPEDRARAFARYAQEVTVWQQEHESPISSLSTLPWLWQSCTELTDFSTFDHATGLFSPLLNGTLYIHSCQDRFGDDVVPRPQWTNLYYGGPLIGQTNILFTNGEYDPTQAVSITSDLGRSVRAIVIPGTAHGGELCPSLYPDNPQPLLDAIQTIGDIVSEWIHPPVCPRNCSGHGRCDPQFGVCCCDDGYTGTDCGTHVSSHGFSRADMAIMGLCAALASVIVVLTITFLTLGRQMRRARGSVRESVEYRSLPPEIPH